MEKDFNRWNEVKKLTNIREVVVEAHERELWWVSLGLNIGVEIDGKNEKYERPVIVIKKFNNEMLWVLPTTAQIKSRKFHELFTFNQEEYFVALTQIRTISTKRLLRKSGMISKEDFSRVIKRLKEYLKMNETPH